MSFVPECRREATPASSQTSFHFSFVCFASTGQYFESPQRQSWTSKSFQNYFPKLKPKTTTGVKKWQAIKTRFFTGFLKSKFVHKFDLLVSGLTCENDVDSRVVKHELASFHRIAEDADDGDGQEKRNQNQNRRRRHFFFFFERQMSKKFFFGKTRLQTVSFRARN